MTILFPMQAEAAAPITRGAILAGYEAVRFKKTQPKLAAGSWTSLQQLQVLVSDADLDNAQQGVKRGAALAKGATVARWL